MSSLEGLHREFAEEMGEIVIEIRQRLKRWKEFPNNPSILQEILRGLHTIKGSAGLLEVWSLSELCHALEDMLTPLGQTPPALDGDDGNGESPPTNGASQGGECPVDREKCQAELEEGLGAITLYLDYMFHEGGEKPDISPHTQRLRAQYAPGRPTITRIAPPPAEGDGDAEESKSPLSLDEAPDITGIFSAADSQGSDMVQTLLQLLTREDQEGQLDAPESRSPITSPLGFDPSRGKRVPPPGESAPEGYPSRAQNGALSPLTPAPLPSAGDGSSAPDALQAAGSENGQGDGRASDSRAPGPSATGMESDKNPQHADDALPPAGAMERAGADSRLSNTDEGSPTPAAPRRLPRNAPDWLKRHPAPKKAAEADLLEGDSPSAPPEGPPDPADPPEASIPPRQRRHAALRPQGMHERKGGSDLPTLGAPPVGERWPQVLMNDWPRARSPRSALKGLIGDHQGSTLKVDIHKLDALLDLVATLFQGHKAQEELIGQLQLQAPGELARKLQAAHRRHQRHLNSLRDSVIRTRMLPIRLVFRRYPNLVEEMARVLGREVSLRITGEDAELDRALIEGLYDPLIHLLRNAVDHGIEAPTERLRLGKNRRGRIELSAAREGALMMIDISDDGRGIDPTDVAKRAIQQGLITEGEVQRLDDEGRLQLIFLPGMSSAQEVTEYSGRGMGMDAVRAQVARLGGRLDVQSTPQQGTRFRLMMPLTLAIIQVLIARVGDLSFALPVSSVVELRRGNKGLSQQGDRWLLNHKHGLLPAQSLACLLGLNAPEAPHEKSHLAILGSAERHFAIWVDKIEGIYECVVKALTVKTTTLPGVTGGVSMGTGDTTFVLDTAVLSQLIHALGPKLGVSTGKKPSMQEDGAPRL